VLEWVEHVGVDTCQTDSSSTSTSRPSKSKGKTSVSYRQYKVVKAETFGHCLWCFHVL